MTKKPAKRKLKARPKPKKKPAVVKKKKPAPQKKGPAPKKKLGDEIGRVVAFFRIPVVAVIRLRKGALKLGEKIWIRGHTTNLKLSITSMQINHQPIQKAKKGDEFGVKIPSRSRIGDRVYRLPTA